MSPFEDGLSTHPKNRMSGKCLERLDFQDMVIGLIGNKTMATTTRTPTMVSCGRRTDRPKVKIEDFTVCGMNLNGNRIISEFQPYRPECSLRAILRT